MEIEFDAPAHEESPGELDSALATNTGEETEEEFQPEEEDDDMEQVGVYEDGDRDEDAFGGEQDEEPAAENDESDRPPCIFISYNDNPQDRRIAARLYKELSPHYEVFYDKETIRLAEDYARVTSQWLQRVDFVIVLISAKSVESQWVITELEVAYERFRREGRPAVIPIYFAYAGPSELDLDLAMRAYIRRFQAVFWDEGNTDVFVDRLHAAIGNRPERLARSSITGMEGLLVGEGRRARMRAAFVPAALAAYEKMLAEKKLLWVTGDPDIRNYVALSIAARQPAASLYEVTKSRTWGEVNNTGVSDSAILLRDTLPAAQFHASAGEELFSLRSLIERNNVIVATTSDEEFERSQPEMHRYEFSGYTHLSVSRTSYDYEAKVRTFNAGLEVSLRAGDLSGEQFAWAAELTDEAERDALPAEAGTASRADELRQRESRARFREVITRWSPSDIERFVTVSLPRAKRREDVARLLQRNAALEDEVRSWFLSLDDSTRCFVLTLATFPEMDDDRLWEMYKTVVEELRSLSPNLAPAAFGICRQRSAPYVSAEGPIYIVDERVVDAVRHEVARSYREYFIELTPKIMEWSVPAGREAKDAEPKAQRKLKIKEGKEVRLAVARMVGVVGRTGLEDLIDLFDYWATDPDYHVRLAVAVALRQTAQSPTGVNRALSLMDEWCRDVNAKGAIRLRPLAAAIALGSIASATPEQYAVPRALNCFRRLARSARPDVRFHVSIALKQLARHVSAAALESILGRIASGDKNAVTRINLAAALHEASSRRAEGVVEEVDRLCKQWLNSGEKGRRWVAVCSLVMSQDAGRRDEQLCSQLEHEQSATTLASVLAELVDDEYLGSAAEDAFCRLMRETDGQAWENLLAGLSNLPINKLERRLLPRIRSVGLPLMDERLTEIRVKVLSLKLARPEHFTAILKDWLGREDAIVLEAFKAVALLVGEGPLGRQPEVISALAHGYEQNQRGGEILARLEALAPSYFAPLTMRARVEALEGLLADPESFVRFAAEGLNRTPIPTGLCEALAILSSGGPEGRRAELCAALAAAYRADPEFTKSLLKRLRATGQPLLAGVTHDVTFRLLADDLAVPADFVTRFDEMLDDDPLEAREALDALNLLAMPGPQGRRRALVNTLVVEKQTREQEVDRLLSLPEFQARPNLAGLPGEVARAALFREVFSRKFVTDRIIPFVKKWVNAGRA